MVSRYGARIRNKENKALAQKKARQDCTRCGKKSLKRVSNAVWRCQSCGVEFAGGAYAPSTETGRASAKFLESLKKATA